MRNRGRIGGRRSEVGGGAAPRYAIGHDWARLGTIGGPGSGFWIFGLVDSWVFGFVCTCLHPGRFLGLFWDPSPYPDSGEAIGFKHGYRNIAHYCVGGAVAWRWRVLLGPRSATLNHLEVQSPRSEVGGRVWSSAPPGVAPLGIGWHSLVLSKLRGWESFVSAFTFCLLHFLLRFSFLHIRQFWWGLVQPMAGPIAQDKTQVLIDRIQRCKLWDKGLIQVFLKKHCRQTYLRLFLFK
jgi:hypothetical protein